MNPDARGAKMKNIRLLPKINLQVVLLAVILAALWRPAHGAVGPNQTWDQLLQEPGLSIANPYQKAFGLLELFNACITRDELKTIQPVSVCTSEEVVEIKSADGVRYEFRCMAQDVRHLSMPRDYSETICSKWVTEILPDGGLNRCEGWESRAFRIPDAFEVTVSQGSGTGFTMFLKRFELPACR
jgi:hypothetical protein